MVIVWPTRGISKIFTFEGQFALLSGFKRMAARQRSGSWKSALYHTISGYKGALAMRNQEPGWGREAKVPVIRRTKKKALNRMRKSAFYQYVN
jgi:hypothetical protein